ncbi:septin-2 isoform X2 [Hyalella azteca]|uniref:Septin n=1 Tax=Hyalella azteca TaxID=294128 RepID=A0A979FHR3_HYAAZ|nr:septin-2 isoform X2 [Hyalella azteca]
MHDEKIRTLKLGGHVGFDSLPEQLVSKATQNGFTFNILCIGETGMGKSTLMDTLFNTSFESTPATHSLPAVKLKSHTYELQESNVRLKLTIVDTVGYGDQVNKADSFTAIVDYIDKQFDDYLQEELKIRRSLNTAHDSRIHACLYFICPTGHGLKSIDLVCMKKLDSKVNIIPIIAKADTVSKVELSRFKARITQEIKSNGIHLYQFPIDDETIAKTNSEMNAQMPFAVVGSTDFVRVGNKMVRARQYPWGTVQVESESHCDFTKLREMLIRTNMEDMREVTHSCHYELYRKRMLEQMGFSDVGENNQPKSFQETFEQKREEHRAELQKKEDDMRQSFVLRVKEKETELKEVEKELYTKYDQLKREHAEEKKRYEMLKNRLEEERSEFTKRRAQLVTNAHHHTLTLGKSKKK